MKTCVCGNDGVEREYVVPEDSFPCVVADTDFLHIPTTDNALAKHLHCPSNGQSYEIVEILDMKNGVLAIRPDRENP